MEASNGKSSVNILVIDTDEGRVKVYYRMQLYKSIDDSYEMIPIWFHTPIALTLTDEDQDAIESAIWEHFDSGEKE